MNDASDNRIKRCKRLDCSRATFVETDEGVSGDFKHGSTNHREVYTVEQMITFLRVRGYVVLEAKEILRVG